MKIDFTLTRFKKSGKFYDEDLLTVESKVLSCSNTVDMSDAIDFIKEKLAKGEMSSSYIYLVNHENGCPCLVNV
jgi:hypothetical protein